MAKMKLGLVRFPLLLAAGCLWQPAWGASFSPIQPLTGLTSVTAYGISADGTTVVGRSSDSTVGRAFRWTAATGTVDLGDLPGGDGGNSAFAVSGDGSHVVGYADDGSRAFLWASGTGMVDIGASLGCGGLVQALGVSDGGDVIAGYSCNGAFRWTEADGGTALPVISGDPIAIGMAVSGDGRVIVGDSNSEDGIQATRWTIAGGAQGLGELPGGDYGGEARDASADGTVIVGWSLSGDEQPFSDAGREAFRWTDGEGMVGLGGLGGSASIAYGVSADGATIVGMARVPGECEECGSEVPRAFIWTTAGGMRSLMDVLLAQGVAGLDGWTLDVATGISADGRTITGYSRYSSDRGPENRAWVVTLDATPVPVPASLWLLTTAFAMLLKTTRSRARAILAQGELSPA